MKAIQGLLAILFLAAGILCGTRFLAAQADAQELIQGKLSANITGTTLIRSGEMLELQAFSVPTRSQETLIFSDYIWKLDGKVVSHKSTLQTRLTRPDEYTLDLSFRDQYGQIYFYTSTVNVMEPEAYEDMMAAVGAAVRLLLVPEDESIYLPLLMR